MIERLTGWFSSNHKHQWKEKREVAIRLTCECGAIEWTQNRPGRINLAKTQSLPTSFYGQKRARHQEWRHLYEDEDLTTPEIGAQYGVSSSAVNSALRRMGVALRPKGPRPDRGHPGFRRIEDPERAAEMVRLRTEEHKSLLEIGEQFGITRERVRQVLVKAGVDMTAAAHERSLATAKKYQRRPALCPVCHEDYGKGNWKAHFQVTRHAPQRKDEQDAAIAADYAAGMLQREIIAKHGVNATSIARAIRRRGVPKRRPQTARMSDMGASKRRKERIVGEYAAGGNVREIAARHGVSIAWVYMAAQTSGVRRRTPAKAS